MTAIGNDAAGVALALAIAIALALVVVEGTPESDAKPGLWAARCGAHKAHWVTHTASPPSGSPVVLASPLVYHVEVRSRFERWRADR